MAAHEVCWCLFSSLSSASQTTQKLSEGRREYQQQQRASIDLIFFLLSFAQHFEFEFWKLRGSLTWRVSKFLHFFVFFRMKSKVNFDLNRCEWCAEEPVECLTTSHMHVLTLLISLSTSQHLTALMSSLHRVSSFLSPFDAAFCCRIISFESLVVDEDKLRIHEKIDNESNPPRRSTFNIFVCKFAISCCFSCWFLFTQEFRITATSAVLNLLQLSCITIDIVPSYTK